MNCFVVKGARDRDAADQLIRFMTTQDAYCQMFTISTRYVYQAHECGWDDSAINENKYAQHVTDSSKRIANDPSGYLGTRFPGPPGPQVSALDIANFPTDMFGEFLARKSPADAVKSDQNRAPGTFNELGAKGE